MSAYEVWTEQLRSAASGWRDQYEILGTARRSVVDAEGGAAATGPAVRPALEAALGTWVDELGRLRQQAQRYADELDAVAMTYDLSDEAAVDHLESLMPWDQRNSAPVPPGGPSGPLPPGVR